MIHRIEIAGDSKLTEVKKLFRKRLMTGGAKLALSPELDGTAQLQVFNEFFAGYAEDPQAANGIAEETLILLAQYPLLTQEVRQLLSAIDNPKLLRVLRKKPNESSSYHSNEAGIVRRFFLAHLGEESAAVQARLRLSANRQLPADIKFLLQRDSSREVRAAAR